MQTLSQILVLQQRQPIRLRASSMYLLNKMTKVVLYAAECESISKGWEKEVN